MRKLLVVFMLCAFVFGASGMASAQDDDSQASFLTMMAAVPREFATDQGMISYADYHALINARPGSFVPADMTEFDTANQQDDPRYPVLMAALNGLGAGMTRLTEVFRIEGMREAVGFDFFTVQRALEFGLPPAMGNVLQGNFDPTAIGAALAARGFTEQPLEGIEGGLSWCSEDGCDAGLQVNVRDRNPADPFGGQLGRKQPLLFVPPDTLLSSSANDVVQAMLASQQSPDDASILSLPGYRAAAEAITSRGTLLQAVIVPAALIAEGMEPGGRSGLPRYELAVLAHVRAEKDVLTLVGLVYPNERLASQATDTLPLLFNGAESLRVRRTFAEMVEERGGTVGKGEPYVSPGSGYAVALLEFRSPVESPDVAPDAQPPAPRASGLIFRLLVQSLYSRDMAWLLPME